jgi:hypothetical protein
MCRVEHLSTELMELLQYGGVDASEPSGSSDSVRE